MVIRTSDRSERIAAQRAVNNRYSTKSLGSMAPIKSSGPCALSPTGQHWWNIPAPAGPVSVGVCRYCQTKKEFSNWGAANFIEREEK